MVSRAVIEKWNQSTKSRFDNFDVRLNRMPYPPYSQDVLVSVIKQTFPLLLIFSLIATFVHTTKGLIHEKETRLKVAQPFLFRSLEISDILAGSCPPFPLISEMSCLPSPQMCHVAIRWGSPFPRICHVLVESCLPSPQMCHVAIKVGVTLSPDMSCTR